MTNSLANKMANKEYRSTFAESYLDAAIATQIRVLRLQQKMSQRDLAERAEMRQSRISAMENTGYSKWTIATLKRLASALDLRLKVSFETFGTLVNESNFLSAESLERTRFDQDPVFIPVTLVQSPSSVRMTASSLETNKFGASEVAVAC